MLSKEVIPKLGPSQYPLQIYPAGQTKAPGGALLLALWESFAITQGTNRGTVGIELGSCWGLPKDKSDTYW